MLGGLAHEKECDNEKQFGLFLFSSLYFFIFFAKIKF